MADGVEITVTVDEASLQKALAALSPGPTGLDFEGLFRALADDFYVREANVWRSQGASQAGVRWEFGSPGYEAKKMKHFGHRRMLELSGALKASMTSSSGAGSVLDITPEGMTVGTSIPYAEKHHLGSADVFDIPEPFKMRVHGVPARPFVTWLADDEARWSNIAVEWLTAAVEKAGA